MNCVDKKEFKKLRNLIERQYSLAEIGFLLDYDEDIDVLLDRLSEYSINYRLESCLNNIQEKTSAQCAFITFYSERRRIRNKYVTLMTDKSKRKYTKIIREIHHIGEVAEGVLFGYDDSTHFVGCPLKIGQQEYIGLLGVIYQQDDLEFSEDLLCGLMKKVSMRVDSEIAKARSGITQYYFEDELNRHLEDYDIGRALSEAVLLLGRYTESRLIRLLYCEDVKSGKESDVHVIAYTDGQIIDLDIETEIKRNLIGEKKPNQEQLSALEMDEVCYSEGLLSFRGTKNTIPIGSVYLGDSPYGYDSYLDRNIIRGFSSRISSRIVNYHMLKEKLCRFIDPKLADIIVRSPQEWRSVFLPAKRNIAMLFSDIVGFSIMAEYLEVEIIKEIIDEYLSRCQNIIFTHGAVYDKSIGDCAVVLVGPPFQENPPEQNAYKAIVLALEIQSMVIELSKEMYRRVNEKLSISIGINVGDVLVGEFGPESSKDFTAIGNEMNIASRTQGCADEGEILVTKKAMDHANAYIRSNGLEPNFSFGEVRREKVKNMTLTVCPVLPID